jgi:hypothetical protein
MSISGASRSNRLVTILGRLGQEVEFSFSVHPRAPPAEPGTAHP